MDIFQHTIRKSVSFAGVGLHSGNPVHLYIKPAAPDSGICFVRTDLDSRVTIPASLHRISDTRLATTLSSEDIQVGTTEHLLAALIGMGVDNAVVELDSDEVPIMDGSAGPFAHLLKKVERQQQKSKRVMLKVTKEISVKNGTSEVRILPYDGMKVTCNIDFDHDMIQKQSLSLEITPESFFQEIASARTFGFLHEVEYMRQNGKALGGSLDNAVVVDQDGVLNVEGLRFSDEFVRHKILDLIGDLALLGCPVLGHVIASKAGHTQHFQLMKAIVGNPDCWQFVNLTHNGNESTLEKMVSSTREVRNKIKPFLLPPQLAPFNRASCSI
ncbi:MAG: UDP-3-O-acyl-N-acetylglucosamine deacetylase [Desulfobulbaceae bacterium]|uniref:UDP-3-O-acyl-N-acetylglucosamine deacetylase n=1 Tax=Candidatus Desulfobia pelagia TaxID=2841692 RepID=A0A8J6NE05_9BACT|nr:UDP-3-O-acyl-N-acetylglucosamine deacetylase [Candidatus Desulfobia pelagia]